jgi:hypothetical protein
VEIFNPQLRKLDPKTISCHFIGILISLRGTYFIVQNVPQNLSTRDTPCSWSVM